MTQKEKDIQLLKKCIETKDADPFVRRYYKVIENTIRSMANKRNIWLEEKDIEDLRQDALMDMFKKDWKRLKDYDETRGMSVTSWVVLLSHHALWDFFGPPEPLDFGNNLDNQIDHQQYNESFVIETDLLQKHWETLETRVKLVFLLKNYLNVPTKDIAEIIDCSASNVFKILEKAVQLKV